MADSLVTELGPDENNYQFESLLHNTEYTASISAIYDWGKSEIVSYAFVTDFVGINENTGSAKVEIFPNPANKQLNIQSETEIVQIEIFNYFGQIVLERNINSKQIILNTSGLEAGIYITRVKTEKGILSKRVVIQKLK